MNIPTTTEAYIASQAKAECAPKIISDESGLNVFWGTSKAQEDFLTTKDVIECIKLEPDEKLIRFFVAKKSTAFVTFERNGILWTHIIHVGEDGLFRPWRKVVECMEVSCV